MKSEEKIIEELESWKNYLDPNCEYYKGFRDAICFVLERPIEEE